jgi:AcrR family transcriptional regulator
VLHQSTARVAGVVVDSVEGLRQRKKRVLREQLSATATRLFVERGFGGVRVAEVAEACGVSEATVFNYFPTKEALVLDRLEAALDALRTSLEIPGSDPLHAVQQVLEDELTSITGWLNEQDDAEEARTSLVRFEDLIEQTPSLLAYQGLMLERYVSAAVEVLARRANVEKEDPEPQIAARGIMCLWLIQAHSLRRHLRERTTGALIGARVKTDVQRAALLLRDGLGTFTLGS